jgi:hypothetical protein
LQKKYAKTGDFFKISLSVMPRAFRSFARSLERGFGICVTMIYTHVPNRGEYDISRLVETLCRNGHFLGGSALKSALMTSRRERVCDKVFFAVSLLSGIAP